LNTPTPSQINVLRASQSREAGADWSIERSIGLDCIEHGWLTEDYYLTDLGKRILEKLNAIIGEMDQPRPETGKVPLP
jgi:hypothetical protein